MSPLTVEQLVSICAHGTASADHNPFRVGVFVEPLNATFEEFSVNTPEERAAFLGQFAHETQGFTHLEENLRYTTVEALLAATKSRWDPLDADDAWGYLNQPERLGNRIYANRMKNGNEASGDGYRYRGRGLPHLTGLGNYSTCGLALGLDLVADPDSVSKPALGCRVGGWYWQHINGNSLVGDFPTLTLRINGGHLGLDSRTAYRDRALAALTS